MTGLERTVAALKGVGVAIDPVDMALLGIAVNALSCLEEKDARYGHAIRIAVSIAQGKPHFPANEERHP
jgi:hypothetical protein